MAGGIGAHQVQLGARGLERAGRQIGNHELPAIAEQGLCNRQPDTGSASGHDCNRAIGHDGLPSLAPLADLMPASCGSVARNQSA
jgi:hypothetical protein